MSRHLRFHDDDEYGPQEREQLTQFCINNPFHCIAPGQWECNVTTQDPYRVEDTGTQYIVRICPFLSPPVTLARIGNIGHTDDGWIRAVRAVMGVAEAGGKVTLVVGKGQWR